MGGGVSSVKKMVGKTNGAAATETSFTHYVPDETKLPANHATHGTTSVAFVGTNKKDTCYLFAAPIDVTGIPPKTRSAEAVAHPKPIEGNDAAAAQVEKSQCSSKPVQWTFFNDSLRTQFDITVTYFHGEHIKVLPPATSTPESDGRVVLQVSLAPGATAMVMEGVVSGFLWKSAQTQVELTEEMKRAQAEAKKKMRDDGKGKEKDASPNAKKAPEEKKKPSEEEKKHEEGEKKHVEEEEKKHEEEGKKHAVEEAVATPVAEEAKPIHVEEPKAAEEAAAPAAEPEAVAAAADTQEPPAAAEAPASGDAAPEPHAEQDALKEEAPAAAEGAAEAPAQE